MKKRNSTPVAATLVFFVGCSELFSQGIKFQREINTIPVIINGVSVANSFGGGFSGSTAPAFADIDGDGDQDLFVGEFDGHINFYRNYGTAINPHYKLVTDRLTSVAGPIAVGINSVPTFADIDKDGDFDLFVGEETGNINFYRNISASRDTIPILFLEQEVLSGIQLYKYSTPTFADIDGDGDQDLFVGDVNGTITLYPNTGTAQSFSYTSSTRNFAFIDVGTHSIPNFADVDKDGKVDLIVGASEGNIYFYQNTGSIFSASFSSSVFIADVGNNSTPVFVDIDKDGDVDLFAGENTSGRDVNIYFYRNFGQAFPQSLQFVTTTFVSNLDVGKRSAPSLVDIDNDNDFDLFVGKEDGKINFYQNIGSATNPIFELELKNPASFDVGSNGVPNFVDIDQDGDRDLFVGERDGRIKYYHNFGTATKPDFRLVTDSLASNAGSIDVGMNSVLTFADIKKDGDADLFVGELDGNINFYRNIGTATNFVFTLDTTNLFSIDSGNNSAPSFVDIDSDRDVDLFVGESGGTIKFYENNGAGTDSILTFEILSENLVSSNGSFSVPVFTDIDKDGDFDLFVGENEGGLHFYRNVTPLSGNRPPVVVNVIPNQTLIIGGLPFTRNFTAIFSDPDGDTLAYAVNLNAPNIVSVNISGITFTVTALSVGSVTVTVTANDGKGGAISTMFGVTVNSGDDQSAPQIVHAPITSTRFGESLAISTSITDNIGVQTAMLYYRLGGATIFSSTLMPNTGGTIYQANIPASAVTARGIEYYILAEDGTGNKATFPNLNAMNKPQAIQVMFDEFTFPNQMPAMAYRMISVSFDLNEKSPASVLEDDLGRYDNTQWRLLRYLNGVNVEFGQPGFANFTPGLGFWLITRGAQTLDVGACKSLTTAQNYIITLPAGWSQIGNPFAFTVNWSEVIKGANVENRLVGYQGSLNEATGYDYTRTQLMPFEGYFVNNRGSTPATIEIPPKAAATAAAKPMADWKSALQSDEWALQITAACDRYLDKDNYLGCFNDAADQWDVNDFSEAPFFDQHVALYFPHADWKIFPDSYTGDFRAVKTTGDYWDFQVQTNISRSHVTLALADVQNVPSHWRIVLLDKNSHFVVNLREQGKYTFLLSVGETKREFRLMVGSEDFIETNHLDLAVIPKDFILEQNFPNPFNPETAIRFGLPQQSVVTIKIYDLAGHEVATLLDRVEFPAGRHQRVWDGRDAQGRIVVSGIYFYRLIAGSFSRTMKLMLVR